MPGIHGSLWPISSANIYLSLSFALSRLSGKTKGKRKTLFDASQAKAHAKLTSYE
jgi:hypothetical protein